MELTEINHFTLMLCMHSHVMTDLMVVKIILVTSLMELARMKNFHGLFAMDLYVLLFSLCQSLTFYSRSTRLIDMRPQLQIELHWSA